jgi:hypothetical protein
MEFKQVVKQARREAVASAYGAEESDPSVRSNVKRHPGHGRPAGKVPATQPSAGNLPDSISVSRSVITAMPIIADERVNGMPTAHVAANPMACVHATARRCYDATLQPE